MSFARTFLAAIFAALLFAAPTWATIGTTNSQVIEYGNGANTVWPFNFLVPLVQPVPLVVTVTNTTVTPNTVTTLLPSQYSVTGLGNPSGGSIVYPLSGSPLATGYTITISRILPIVQTTSLCNQGPTFCAIEHALDYVTMVEQQLQTQITQLFAIIQGTQPAPPVLSHALPNVIDNCGAAGNGVTDDTSAFALCASLYREFQVPSAIYYSVSGIVEPSGEVIDGLGFNPGNPPTGATILCALSVSPCLDLTTGSNGTAVANGLVVSRVAGTIPSGVIGVRTNEAYNPELYNIFAYRHAVGFDFKMCGPSGLGGFADRIFTGAITDAHMVFDGIAEFRVTNSRFGMNGAGDFNGTTYQRFEGPSCGTYVLGSGPNTFYFTNDQFNLGTNSVTYWAQFIDLVSSTPQTVEWYYDGIHIEGVSTALITSDSTWTQLEHFEMTNITENEPVPVFSLNAATTLDQFHIDNSLFPGSLTLSPSSVAISQLSVSNSYIGAVTLSPPVAPVASIANFSNVDFGGLTLSGNWYSLVINGDIYTGALTNTATGNTCLNIPGFATCGGGGGGGTVNPGTAGQLSYYATTGSAVSTNPNLTYTLLSNYAILGVGRSSSGSGEISLAGFTGGATAITVPASAGSYVLTLPSNAGSTGQFLQTNGSGVTTWASPSGSGTVNAGTTNQIAYYTASTAVSSNPYFTYTLSGGNLAIIGIGNATTVQGELSLAGVTSGATAITVPNVAGSYVLTLPANAGSNGQFLQTNGSGVTAWASPSGSGTVNSGIAGELAYYATTGTAVSTNANLSYTLAGGIAILGIGNASTAAGEISLAGGTSGATSITVPAAAGSYTLTLPASGGSNGQFLQTNGSGTTTWATVSGSGTVNSGTAGNLAYYATSTNAVSTNAYVTYTLSGGNLAILGIGNATTVAGEISLAGLTSGATAVKVPAVAGSYTLTLPATTGTNGQFLQTNGSGTTTWASPSGSGTVNSGTAGELAYYATSGTAVSTNANLSYTLSGSTAILGVGNASTAAGEISLAGSSSGATAITVPAAAGSYVLTLPSSAGSNGQFLQTNGSGVTTWATPSSSGTVNSGSSGNIAYYATSGTAVSGLSALSYAGSAPQLTLSGSGSELEMLVTNSSAGSGQQSVLTLATGTANAYLAITQTDSGSSSSATIGTGPADGNGMTLSAAAGGIAVNVTSGNTVSVNISGVQLAVANSAVTIPYLSSCSGISTGGSGLLNCIVSARRFKNPKGKISEAAAFDGLDEIKPVAFTYKDSDRYGVDEHVGLYADDVCKMDRRLCLYDKDGKVKGYDERGVIAYLVAAEHRMKAEIDELKRHRP